MYMYHQSVPRLHARLSVGQWMSLLWDIPLLYKLWKPCRRHKKMPQLKGNIIKACCTFYEHFFLLLYNYEHLPIAFITRPHSDMNTMTIWPTLPVLCQTKHFLVHSHGGYTCDTLVHWYISCQGVIHRNVNWHRW